MAIDTDSVRDRFDIVDVISGYIDLKKAGKNYQACCPFHDEKSPSFSVNQNKQFFNCFGCGASGDVMDFVMKINRVEFIDAIRILDKSLLDDDKPQVKFVKVIRARYYLDQVKPTNIEQTLSKCLFGRNSYFLGSDQVLPLINVSGERVSLALVKGKGYPIRFLNKELIWGSFFTIGELNKPAVIVTDYFKALSIRSDDHCILCVFDSLNIGYVCEELRRFNIPFNVLCCSKEDFIQAEKKQVYKVYFNTVGNTVVTDEFLDNQS